MRTTTWEIVQLAWLLWRDHYRQHTRIGQTLVNAFRRQTGQTDIFYVENDALLMYLRWWNERFGK